MKTKRYAFVFIAGGIAAAVAVTRGAVGIDGLIGYGAVIALVAFAALDYGLRRRRWQSK